MHNLMTRLLGHFIALEEVEGSVRSIQRVDVLMCCSLFIHVYFNLVTLALGLNGVQLMLTGLIQTITFLSAQVTWSHFQVAILEEPEQQTNNSCLGTYCKNDQKKGPSRGAS